MKKAIRITLAALLICAVCAAFCGCLGSYETTKKLTGYYTQSPVKAARYYQKYYENEQDVYRADELDPSLLPALAAKLDEMALTHHGFHTDYYWGGRFGLELEFEDGTFMTYDGTKAEYRSKSMLDGGDASENRLSSDFLEVTNMSFGEAVGEFFEAAIDKPEY